MKRFLLYERKIYILSEMLDVISPDWRVLVSKMQKLLQRQNLNFPLNYYQRFSTAALWFVSVCVQLTEERCYVTTFLLDRSLSSVSYVWKKESKWSGKSWCKLMVFSVDSQFLGVLKSFMLKWGDQILQHCSLILVSRIMEIWTDPIQKLTHFLWITLT